MYSLRNIRQKPFDVVSKLLLGCNDLTMSNQRWNNAVYANVEIHIVEQRQINLVYLNIDINNVRQRRNNTVIFNVEFHKADQRQNYVVNMTIFKKLKKVFLSFKKGWFIWLLSSRE